jgi:hypothetical protein
MIKYRYLIKIFLIFFFQKKEDFKDDIQCENWGLFQSGCSQLVGFQNATTPAFQFKGTKVKPHMSYASMLLKLQIIRALEEDKNGFFFLAFNHEDQIPCKPVDLVSFFFVKT